MAANDGAWLTGMLADPAFKKLSETEQLYALKNVGAHHDKDFAALPDDQKQRIALSMIQQPVKGRATLGTMTGAIKQPGWLGPAKMASDIAGPTIGGIGGGLMGGPMGGIAGAGLGGVVSDRADRYLDRLAGYDDEPQSLTDAGATFANNAMWQGIAEGPFRVAGRAIAQTWPVEGAISKAEGELAEYGEKQTPEILKKMGEQEGQRQVDAALPKLSEDASERAAPEARNAYQGMTENALNALKQQRESIIGPPGSPDITPAAAQEVRQGLTQLATSADGHSLYNKLQNVTNNAIPSRLLAGKIKLQNYHVTQIWDAIEQLRANAGLSAGEEKLATDLQQATSKAMDSFLNSRDMKTLQGISSKISNHLRLFSPDLLKQLNKASNLEEAARVYFKDPRAAFLLARAATTKERNLLRQMFGALMYDESKGNIGKMAGFFQKFAPVAKELGISDINQFLSAEGRFRYISNAVLSVPRLENEFKQALRTAMGRSGISPNQAAIDALINTRGLTGFLKYLQHRALFHLLFFGTGVFKKPVWLAEMSFIALDYLRVAMLRNPWMAEKFVQAARPGSTPRQLGDFVGHMLAYAAAGQTKKWFNTYTPQSREEREQEDYPHAGNTSMPQGAEGATE